MRFSDLARKEVINVTDCKCLGNVIDIDLDEKEKASEEKKEKK